MSFNIDRFKSSAGRHGFLRTSRFRLLIPGIPLTLRTALMIPNDRITTTEAARHSDSHLHISFMCSMVNLPGVNNITHEVRRFGYGALERKPFVPSFNDLVTEIIDDGEGNNYNFISRWIQYSLNYDYSTLNSNGPGNIRAFEVNFKDNYAVQTGTIEVFREDGFKAKEIELNQFFPISITDGRLNWADTNSLSTFTVQWSYFTWKIVQR